SRLPLTLNLQPHPTTRPLRRQQVIHRSPNTLKQLRREPRSRQILRHHLSDVKAGPPIRRFEEPGLPRLRQRLIPIGRHRMPPRIRLRHINLADNLHRVSLRLLGLRPMPHPFSSTLTNRTSRTHQRPFPNQSSKPRAVTSSAGATYIRCFTTNVSRPENLGTARKARSEEHTSELQSREKLVCRLLREKKKGSASR